MTTLAEDVENPKRNVLLATVLVCVFTGVFGGLLPLVGLLVVAGTGNIYAGLYYPIVVAATTFVVGSLLLKETRHVLIWDELETDGQLVSDMDGPA